MSNIFSERFKSARLLSGLSLQDVSDALSSDLTRQAVYRYEKGEVIPDSKTLAELSRIFNVHTDFFFRPMKVSIGKVEYRKLKIPVKEEKRLEELTKDYLSRYLELEELLGIKTEFVNPLADFPTITSYNSVNEAANILRAKWDLGLNAISNIAELLEDMHIKVVEVSTKHAFDGLQTFVNKNIPVIAYNEFNVKKLDRIRFTLLHELAHLLLKFDVDYLTKNQIETLCHQFAGAMLLPEKIIKQEIGENRNQLSLDELGKIKMQYGVSMQAIVMRAFNCGIVTQSYKKRFFKIMNDNDWRIDEPVDYIGNEKSGRFDQFIYRALSEEVISLSKAASLKNMSITEFKSQMIK